MIKIGVIADTHGHLDRQVLEIFAGVDHILHAGDIGLPALILELEDVAPVTAVLGNADVGLDFKETAILELGGRKFLVHHLVDISSPDEALQRRILRERPDVVVFGHTHKRCCEMMGETLYFNPGYAGKRKSEHLRSVAILNCDDDGISADYFEL
jgi:hypothetical protein